MSVATALQIRKGDSVSLDPQIAAKELFEAIYQKNAGLTLFYCSPAYDLPALAAELRQLFDDVNLIGCTTAGEITPCGYLDGSITGVSIASDDFTVATERISNLSGFEISHGDAIVQSLKDDLARSHVTATAENSFGFLLIDGLCMQEEAVVSSLFASLGEIQLAGGSAGDGERFSETFVYHNGEFHANSAVFSLIHTSHPFLVFKTEHFVGTEKKMVITEADPANRIVSEINGEPAGREYARLVGLEVDKLTPMIFATYPVVVKVGGVYYVRSIQKVNADESLTFFCAIDEGIVLTVARGVDMMENLKQAFTRVEETIGRPRLTLGCDCILRNLELDKKGLKEQAGRIMCDNNVIGFSTYGEQFNAMHVNQTFTGIAIG